MNDAVFSVVFASCLTLVIILLAFLALLGKAFGGLTIIAVTGLFCVPLVWAAAIEEIRKVQND